MYWETDGLLLGKPKRAGLKLRLLDLRHTHATLMLLAGVHPKIVSEMLGHSSVAFTLDVYSQVVGGWQKAAMKRLDEVLKPEMIEDQNVGKMSARDSELDGEPHRARTCNLLFKSLSVAMKKGNFSYKRVKTDYLWK